MNSLAWLPWPLAHEREPLQSISAKQGLAFLPGQKRNREANGFTDVFQQQIYLGSTFPIGFSAPFCPAARDSVSFSVPKLKRAVQVVSNLCFQRVGCYRVTVETGLGVAPLLGTLTPLFAHVWPELRRACNFSEGIRRISGKKAPRGGR